MRAKNNFKWYQRKEIWQSIISLIMLSLLMSCQYYIHSVHLW